MAKQKKNPNASGYTPKDMGSMENVRDELEKSIYANNFNLDPDFFKKNEKILEGIKKTVKNIASTDFGYKQSKDSLINPIKNYERLVLSTIDPLKDNELHNFDKQSITTSSGIRSVLTDETSSDNIELDMIKSFGRLMNNSYVTMKEYRNIVKLIPELKKVLRMVVRDIINANEITERSLINVYKPKKNSTNINQNQVEAVNQLIEKHVIDKYSIEKKQSYWFLEAVSSGCKPIAVFPYKDIIEQALVLEKERREKNSGLYSEEDIKSLESIDCNSLSREELFNSISDIDIFSNENLDNLGGSIYEKRICDIKDYKSEEGLDKVKPEKARMYKKIIDNSMIETLFDVGMEELYTAREHLKKESSKYEHDRSTEGIDNSKAIDQTLDNIDTTLKKIKGEDVNEESSDRLSDSEEIKIKKNIEEKLKKLVDAIDSRIEVVQDKTTAFVLGKNFINSEKRYKKYTKKATPDVLSHDDIVKQNQLKNHDKNSKYNSDIDEDLDPNSKLYSRNSLILELDGENVIPIVVGSEHVGYYVYEREALYGREAGLRHRLSSFTDLIKATGYGDDKSTISSSYGVQVSPNDPANSSVFSPMGISSDAGEILMGKTMSGSPDTKRVEILKRIIIKTAAQRLKDPDLVENKQFTDTIMGLVRDGYIIEKQIHFTFIPSSNMVYFAPDLDDKGIAHSILDSTLLIWYMYLSSIISSLMIKLTKSSDKEKLELNMGLNGQIGMSLGEIQKSLSTRSIYMRSFFDNVGTVLKNSSVYQRITIPIFDGEKLYDVNPVETVNDYNIDDDYTDKLKTSGISVTGVPPSIFNSLSEAEFSRSVVTSNLEYRSCTMERQKPSSEQMNKLLRILCRNEGIVIPIIGEGDEDLDSFDPEEFDFGDNSSNRLEKINLQDIRHTYKPSNALNMTSISETFSNIEPVISAYVTYFFGEDIEDTLTKEKVSKVKKELTKMLANNIDLDEFEDLVERVTKDAPNDALDKAKDVINSKNIDKLKEGGDSSF